jgi:hypothetical protein
VTYFARTLQRGLPWQACIPPGVHMEGLAQLPALQLLLPLQWFRPSTFRESLLMRPLRHILQLSRHQSSPFKGNVLVLPLLC